MQTPRTGDGERAWRRYAGELRKMLGESHTRDRRLLDAVERDLDEGDFPAAVERLAQRRERLEAAGIRKGS